MSLKFCANLGVCCLLVVGVLGCRKDNDAAIKKFRQRAAKSSDRSAPQVGAAQAQGQRSFHALTTRQTRPLLRGLASTPIGDSLKGFRLGPPLRYKRIAVFPVEVARALPRASTPLTIDESFKKKKVQVTEEGSGNVPQIALRKRRSAPIFIMTGDMFLGAKQDRISKHDLLLPQAKGQHKIPVYCVEQGRWRYGSSSSFRAGNAAGSWRLRRSASKKLSQSEIWRNVGQKTRNLNARTSTDTMAATYRSRRFRKQSPAYLKRLKGFFTKHPKAIGYIGLIKGKVANMELFANNELLRKMWPKMSKAMVLDAIDPKYKTSKISRTELVAFLQQLKDSTFQKTKTPGMGSEYLITHRQLSGTLLLHRKRLVHLSIFPDDNRGLKRRTNGRMRRIKRLYRRRSQAHPLNHGLGSLGNKSGSLGNKGYGLAIPGKLKAPQRKWSRRKMPPLPRPVRYGIRPRKYSNKRRKYFKKRHRYLKKRRIWRHRDRK